MVVMISYVDSQSTVRGSDIDLNAAPETDAVGDDGSGSSDSSDHEVDSDSDPDVDEIPDDIDNEGVSNDGNVNASSVRSQIRRIVIHNNPEAHMSFIDPDATHAVEFLEYSDILPTHRLAVNFNPDELLVGQDSKVRKGAYLPLSTRYIYPEVTDVGDTKICWASHMHFNTHNLIMARMTNCNLEKEFFNGCSRRLIYAYAYFSTANRLCKYMDMAIRRTWNNKNSSLRTCGVYHGDPFTASDILRLTFTEIIRMQTGSDKLLTTLMPIIGQQQVNQIEAGYVFVKDVKGAIWLSHTATYC
ncbi:hypothetical protein GOBAR_DD05699 [Gossypium barbadense]|nr:hypothetical protein GOBAR_DD05699 [Gossypium barbadense]